MKHKSTQIILSGKNEIDQQNEERRVNCSCLSNAQVDHLTVSDLLKNCFFLQQEQCRLPQMHLLSVFMAPRLHSGCAPNCEDPLAQMPEIISVKILSLLDPGLSRLD
jgi:hypothetical protein